jgi:hypothetical protein
MKRKELLEILDDFENRTMILLAQVGNQRVRDLNGKPLLEKISKLREYVTSISRD